MITTTEASALAETHGPTRTARTPIANSQMRAYRFERWARNRALFAKITGALRAGKRVTLGTYTRATTYDARHLELFSVDRYGCYVRAGKRRDDITGCAIVISG
jgi:hypothetical protein